MSPKTRLFFFSHVLSPTGLVLPAAALCAEARKRGIITVVDGAHAPAMIPLESRPSRPTTIRAIATSGCSPRPAPASWLSGRATRIGWSHLHVSWGYRLDQYPLADQPALRRDPNRPDPYGSTPRTRFLEFEGTRDICPWLAVPDAIDFQAAIGVERIREAHRRVGEIYARANRRARAEAGNAECPRPARLDDGFRVALPGWREGREITR